MMEATPQKIQLLFLSIWMKMFAHEIDDNLLFTQQWDSEISQNLKNCFNY